MTVSELMQKNSPDPSFVGQTTADDMILAVDFLGTATDPAAYTVAEETISEASGALTTQTQNTQYLRTGQVTTKTGTSRVITLNGDRTIGDPFQDGLLDPGIKFGRGQSVVKKYVYFNLLTGVGEQGEVTIVVNSDYAGAAGANSGFSATLTSKKEPQAYTYTPTP